MVAKLPLFLLVLVGPLCGAPPDSLAIQEMRQNLDNITHQLHSHNVELALFQERIQTLEASFKTSKELKPSEKALEKRVAALEKTHEALVADFTTLKNHLNETCATLSICQNQLNKIDKQLTSDIQTLKSSLNSMLTLLQSPSNERTYVVQPGDSLGQIALDHKTTIKHLKELNHLSADTIYTGQKLLLP